MLNRDVVLFGIGAGLVVVLGAAWAARKLPGAAGALANEVNPFNPDNVFARSANRAAEAVTGDPSLGGWLAEVFNPDVAAANNAMRAPVTMPGVDFGEIGLGYDIAYGSGGPVFVDTPGGAAVWIFR